MRISVRCLAVAWSALATVAGAAASAAPADFTLDPAPADFTLDPARSRFTLGGTFNGASLVAQSPGSDVTGFAGILSVDVDQAAGTLSVLSGRPIAVEQPADQRPFTRFDSVAVYGLATAGADNLLAVRGFDLYVRADDARYNAGAATPDEVGFFVNGGTLYYSTPGDPDLFADLHGYGSSGRVVDFVGLAREGDVETLTIPIRTQFAPYTGEGSDDVVVFTFAGQLVATRVVPEPGALTGMLGLALLLMKRRRRLGGGPTGPRGTTPNRCFPFPS